MTNQQGALQYADRDHTDLGSYYMRHVSAMTGEALHSKSAIAAELAHRDREIDRLQAENANLNAGYAAARLEIESLQARIKTMAEVRVYELAMAHLDGRMRGRSTEPAGEYPALPEPFCAAHDDADSEWPDMFSARQMRAFADATYALRAPHWQAPAQAAPQQDTAGVTAGAAPDGWKLVPVEPAESMLSEVDEGVGGHCHSCTKWRASYDDCRRIYAAMLAAAPQPSKEQP